MKQYCSTLLPYVSEQPMKAEQLPAAVFEANALSCVVAHGNEIDWSQQAPAAKRSRQVSKLLIMYLSQVKEGTGSLCLSIQSRSTCT